MRSLLRTSASLNYAPTRILTLSRARRRQWLPSGADSVRLCHPCRLAAPTATPSSFSSSARHYVQIDERRLKIGRYPHLRDGLRLFESESTEQVGRGRADLPDECADREIRPLRSGARCQAGGVRAQDRAEAAAEDNFAAVAVDRAVADAGCPPGPRSEPKRS